MQALATSLMDGSSRISCSRLVSVVLSRWLAADSSGLWLLQEQGRGVEAPETLRRFVPPVRLVPYPVEGDSTHEVDVTTDAGPEHHRVDITAERDPVSLGAETFDEANYHVYGIVPGEGDEEPDDGEDDTKGDQP